MAESPHVTREAVFGYLSEALEPEELTAFEAHVSGCALCNASIEEKRAFLGVVQNAFAAPKVSDLELLNRARATFEAREKVRRRRRFYLFAGFGLAFAALVGVTLFLHGTAPEKTTRKSFYAP